MLSIEADDEAKTVVSETEWALNQSETESVGKGFVCTLYMEQKSEASNEAFNDSTGDLPYILFLRCPRHRGTSAC